MKNFLLTLLVAITPVIAETHFLNFEKCLDRALAQSYMMKTLKENFLSAEFELKAATNSLRTNIGLNLTAPNYRETMQRFEDSLGVYYTPIKQAIYSTSLRINQPLPTDGEIYVSSGFYSTSDYFRDKNTLQLNTRVGFEQPLEAVYSYNRIQAELKRARLNYEQSQKTLRRAELDLKYDVSQYFYNLVSSQEQEKISRQTLDYQQEACNLAQNKYKAGVIAEVEALQMEVDLAEAENNYSIAQSNVQAHEDRLKQMLGIDLKDELKLDYDLTYNKVYVDLEEAVNRGMQYRLEIRESEISKELAEISLKQTRVSGQITGSISGYYDFIGVGENDINMAYSNTIDGAVDNMFERTGNRGVSLDISIPVWDWGVNRARVNAAKARIRRADYTIANEKVNVQRDIRSTVNDLQSALRRLELLEQNVVVAEKSFEISTQRFANGDIDSQDLALNRNRLNNAYTSRLSAYITYKLKLADLTRKTFYDYENKKAIID
ncbi:MAG: TolC family protein [Candidatus Marinimicrobia bacterium]|nr:TolC family protein [Candidatus Neomarinimicrobiota bacterium]